MAVNCSVKWRIHILRLATCCRHFPVLPPPLLPFAVFGCLLLYYSVVPFCLLPYFPSVLHSLETLSRTVSHALLCNVFHIGRRFSYHEHSLKKTATWKKRNN